MVFKNRGTLFETQIMPPVRNDPSDTQTKRTRNPTAHFKPKSGGSGKLVVTPLPKNASGSAKRKRQTSIVEGRQDAMADAAADRDITGSHGTQGVAFVPTDTTSPRSVMGNLSLPICKEFHEALCE